jgi:hypothetical protein
MGPKKLKEVLSGSVGNPTYFQQDYEEISARLSAIPL